MALTYDILDDLTINRLVEKGDLASLLVLEEDPEFPGQWRVLCVDKTYIYHFYDIIGSYRLVAPSRLEELFSRASAKGYRIAFGSDPTHILDSYRKLDELPEVELNSTLPHTVNGLLPYQVQGYNFLKDLPGGVAMWSTGTGKTVLASALIKYHLQRDAFDYCFFVVKSHNKVNTQRTLQRLGDVPAIILNGEKSKRLKLYQQMAATKEPQVVITNYEKFRVDLDLLSPFFGHRVMIIWDEMPTKLKNRRSQLYRSVCSCLYELKAPAVSKKALRPKQAIQYMLSATPIENNPQDWFNCVRLLDPGVYGSVAQFEAEYVYRYNFFDPSEPELWQNLDKMGLKAAHIVHQVDKNDPDIAAQFPDVLEEERIIDWDTQDRALYNRIRAEYDRVSKDSDEINILAMILLMQMLCDAPSSVADSALLRKAWEETMAAFTEWSPEAEQAEKQKRGSFPAMYFVEQIGIDKFVDDRHTKIETLRQLLQEEHPDEKIVLFTTFSDALHPVLMNKLEEWQVPYVRYAGTDSQRQKAQDTFMQDPAVRVFLSSDTGSDSLNLEQASIVIHYDLPWKYSTLIQRQNRIHRVTSDYNKVRYYTLLMDDSIEYRKLAIIRQKQGFHEGVFKGAIADQAQSARMSKQDLLYILRGQ